MPNVKENGKAAEWFDPKQLVPWSGNPRRNDAAVDDVAKSIKEFGFGAPMVARLANREIISGHTRHKAALKLGLERVPVRFLDIDEETAHRLARADNRLGELADWDPELLLAQLSADFAAGGKEALALQGFRESDLNRLVKQCQPPEEFERVGPDIEVTHTCPKCGYRWS